MEPFKKYILSVDKDLRVISYGEEFLAYVGRDELRSLDQVVPPQDMIQLRNAVFAIDPGKLNLSCFRIRTAGGTLNWIAANVEKSEHMDETIHMELSDIQSMKSESVTSQYDEMTGLLNKQSVTELAKGYTQQYPRRQFYFCLMDIDHFKSVNDTFGHMCGDEVIIDVAHILRDCVGDLGSVGRIGGDEFMLVLEKVHEKPKARELLARIRETVEEKYLNYKGSFNITVSIGCTLYPDYAADYDELFKTTDQMLYRAKMKGRNRYIIYTPEVHGNLNAEAKVASVSHRAAEEDEKVSLILDYMDRFLRRPDVPIMVAIERVMSAYDLDELYVFYGDLEASHQGIVRTELAKDSYRIEETTVAMPILGTEAFRNSFDKNRLAVINVYDLSKDRQGEIIRFMEEKKYRFMVVYHMAEAKKEGYVVYINHMESACRLSESDIADLAYFGRMVELSSYDR